MKKILLSVTFFVASLSLNAQVTTTLFENNFDTNLANLSSFDIDGDGDNSVAWQGAPPAGVFPPAFVGGIYVFDGREATNGYKNDATFDFNSIETKSKVTFPAGGSAEISFDLIAFLRSGNTAYTQDLFINLYEDNITYKRVAQYTVSMSTTNVSSYKQVKVSMPDALGKSYIVEIAQFDDPRKLSEFIIDNLKITHTTSLSTNDFLSSKFSVYPNPANNVVNILNDENILVNNVTVTDLNGRTVKNVSFDNVSNLQVDVADLASGLYLMNITSDKGTATKKIVKN